MMDEFRNEIERINSLQETENGAIGYSTTKNELVDLNFKIPSFRGGVPTDSLMAFDRAMERNLSYAIKWLFFLRDVREGLGEKRAFTEFFVRFMQRHPNEATKMVSLIAEYGRWKDIFDIIECANIPELKKVCYEVVEKQLREDIENCTANKPISLLAKWMPSINASDSVRHLAMDLRRHLGISNREYRKMLSRLRKHIGVVERFTCANEWEKINYETVPSRANLRYKDAFAKHDGYRYEKYLEAVMRGDGSAKMNASVLYPYEIWAKYTHLSGVSYWNRKVNMNNSLEAMWMNLKDIDCGGNTMVVCDGSGSMTTSIKGANEVWAIDVSRSLSVYFAERCEGEFKNKFIEFSSNPHFIDISGCNTLADKIALVDQYNDCSNTDIEKVFMLLLNTALKNQMKQSDLPERILIISDMEFDSATTCAYERNYFSTMKTLFDTISERYESAGYKMPRLVFWNVNSRTDTIPVKENELGVALVSGFSVNIAKMVMSGKTDPWLILKETLDSERYAPIDKVLSSVQG
jgi:hypothetical protein